MVKRFFFLLLFASTVLAGLANDITLEIEQAITQEEKGKTIYTAQPGRPFIVKIIAASDKKMGDIEIRGLDHFSVLGQSKSNHVSTINGTISRKIIYNLTVMSDQEGEFTIGPAQALVNGNKIASNSTTIRISTSAQIKSRAENNNDQEGTTAFCKLHVDTTSVVIGQPITASLKIFTRGPVRNISLGEQPSFSGFLVKEIKNAQSKQEVFEGEQYNVTEKKYILFPLQQGNKVITPLSIVIDVPQQARRSHRRGFFDEDFFSDFFGPRVDRRQIKTSPITITVNQLPEYKKRFDGVGQFTSFKASLDKNEASINEPFVLTLRIEGKGNLDQIPTPKIRLPNHFKYYDSKTTVDENLDIAYTGGKKTFEFILQATKPGLLKIPAQSFTFYDTQHKKFKTLTTNALTIEIKATADYTPPPAVDQDIKPSNRFGDQAPDTPTPLKEKTALSGVTPAEDIHFIQEEVRQKASQSIPWWIFLLLLIIPALFYQKAALAYLLSFFKHFSGKKSLSQFNQQLDDIIKKQTSKKLHHFFLMFFAAKYHVDIQQVTEDWIITRLEKENWEPEKINEFIEYIHVCAGLHFASHSLKEDSRLLKRAQYWLLHLTK